MSPLPPKRASCMFLFIYKINVNFLQPEKCPIGGAMQYLKDKNNQLVRDEKGEPIMVRSGGGPVRCYCCGKQQNDHDSRNCPNRHPKSRMFKNMNSRI